MQIVIDIPEKRYKDILRIAEVQLDMRTDTVEQIIANGTPLPKSHGRLIDVEVFTNNVIKYSHQSTKTIGQALADTPTIIEADKAGAEMKLCKDCEYFEIKYEPYKVAGCYTEWGQAECKKHNLVTDFKSHKKFESLECVEVENDT